MFCPTGRSCDRAARIDLKKRLKDKSDAPAETRGDQAKNNYKLKETDEATFFLPTNEWRERKFVVDSGASMHLLSQKGLNSAELETVKVSRNLTTIVTANGEVQTKEEATVYVKELDLFVTVKLLDDTSAVLSLGKPCEDHPVVKNHNSHLHRRKS